MNRETYRQVANKLGYDQHTDIARILLMGAPGAERDYLDRAGIGTLDSAMYDAQFRKEHWPVVYSLRRWNPAAQRYEEFARISQSALNGLRMACDLDWA